MPGGPDRRFATTRWSLVVSTRTPGAPEAAAALATLCEIYWFPVYAFIRRSGRSEDAARDLTQGFFARMLEKNYFKDADRARGRFRTFLLTSVSHFLANEHKARQTLKRGGAVLHFSLDTSEEERRFQIEPADTDTPDRIYERRWALAVFDQTMARLSAHYDAAGRGPWFARLRPSIMGDHDDAQPDLAEALGLTAAALRVTIHRLRRRFAETLREVVAETVDSPDAVDDEVRYLTAIVSR